MKNELDANHPVELKVYGTTRRARGYTIRDFLTRGDVPFEWVRVTGDDQARAIGLENMEDPRLPVCVFFDGSWVDCPAIRQIAEKLGWYRNPSRSKYDLAIYGYFGSDPYRSERKRRQCPLVGRSDYLPGIPG